jgi:hypothetical protein
MQSHIIYRRELFLKAMVYLIICLGVEIVLIEMVRSTAITVVGLIVMALPLVFLPWLLSAFTREVNIDLNPDQFSFEIMNKKGPEEKTIKLSELESYSIQIPTDKFNSIRFVGSNGKAHEFSFFKQKKDVSDVDSVELIESFKRAINDYNGREEISKKITLRPSFYASNVGLYCIIGLSVFLFAGILLVFYKGKSVPLAFLTSLLLILQLVSKRRKELQYYKSIE